MLSRRDWSLWRSVNSNNLSDPFSLEVDDRCLSEFVIASLLIKSEQGSDDSDIRSLHAFHRIELGSRLNMSDKSLIWRRVNVLKLDSFQIFAA
jgi:hypothetical protein